MPRQNERSNQEWIDELRGYRGEMAQRNAFIDLGRYLHPIVYHHLKSRQSQTSFLHRLSSQELAERAEDFVQDMFVLKLLPDDYALLKRFSAEGYFKAWIKQVQINFVIDLLRKEKVREKKDPSFFQAPVISPEEEILIKETMKDLEFCVEQLGPNYRLIYKMRFIEELSVEDIAHKLNKTASQVHMLVHHTRKKLRRCLRGRNIDDDIFNDLF